MGLRDRKTSRIREPGFNGHSVEGSHALYRKAGYAFSKIFRNVIALIKKVIAFDYAKILIKQNRDDKKSHFAETTLGGITIAIGSIFAILVILWLGSFL